MKISVLVKALKKAQADYGDILVAVSNDDEGTLFTVRPPANGLPSFLSIVTDTALIEESDRRHSFNAGRAEDGSAVSGEYWPL